MEESLPTVPPEPGDYSFTIPLHWFWGTLRTKYVKLPVKGEVMKRYFFDLGREGQSVYDHQGRDFQNDDAAYQLAELIALDLEVEGEWVGWTVAVRSPEGRSIFSIPVANGE